LDANLSITVGLGGPTVLQSGLKSKHFRYISHVSEHTEIHVIISIKQQVAYIV